MQDKTTIGISDLLRQFIEALVEEVVLEGMPFEEQKKWLRKYSEVEGRDYASIEKSLTEFFETVEELKSNESKAGVRLAKMLAKDCYLEEGKVDELVSAMNEAREKEAKRIAAEKKAEEERIAREKAEREAKEEKKQTTGELNGHEYVDLGLPSGTLWATCNVGAIKPEEFGGYFAWGEIEEKNEYTNNTYKWYRWSDTRRCRELAKYCDSMVFGKVDNKWKLDLKDDVAHVKWDGKWCLPTQEQFQELKAQCKSEWVLFNGVEGRRFTSKINGNSIFFPACGYLSGSELRENRLRKIGNYWSSYRDQLDWQARVFRFSKSVVSADEYSFDRICGCSVRPVLNN